MFWLKDNEESMSSVIAFIDQFTTVDVTNTDLAPYVEYHGHSCLKNVRGQSICRFGIHDDGYRILKGIRTSPAHWEDEKKKVMVMIRQFGLPTFFITLSAAETRWSELIVLLKRNLVKVEINQEEALNLKLRENARLIRTDPVMCARYFDYRYREVIKLMKKPWGILGSNFVTTFY